MRSYISTAVAGAIALAAVLAPSAAKADVVVVPEAYVATYQPFYYNGFAHYFYRNHWYYRDHGAWRGYEHEPAFLHDHRGEWASHWHHWR
jgi:hypothetical protein